MFPKGVETRMTAHSLALSGKLALVGALLASACDTTVSDGFIVSSIGDDSTGQHSKQIADALAQRHGLRPQALDSSCDVGSYEATMSPSNWLDFCVDQGSHSVTFGLTQYINRGW